MRNLKPFVILFFNIIFWTILGSVSLALSPEDHGNGRAVLERYIEEALEKNPEIKALERDRDAYQARVPQAGALPDPQLGISLMNLPVNSFSFSQEPMTGKVLTAMQMVPFPGKLDLKEKIAEKEALIADRLYENKRNEIIRKVKETYFYLYFIRKAIQITEKNKNLMAQFVQIAQTKYGVGTGIQQDVLRAQLELSKFTDRLITLGQKEKALKARLNTLLNRPPRSGVSDLGELEPTLFEHTLDDLEGLVMADNPMLQAAKTMVEKGEKGYRLAQKDYLPNFGFSFSYNQREEIAGKSEGNDYFSGMVILNIPLYFWRKQRKHVEETQLKLSAAEEGYQHLKNELSFKISDLFTDALKGWDLLELYRTGIIPQASQSLNSTLAGYQVNKVDFLTLLNGQMTLFKYEVDYYRILADYEKDLAAIEMVVGKRLF
ncbi:TolC family protein [candidate division KSB1 bacterium]|nr:TolC family protein [candidate division KSB1 bacterium]